MTRLFLTLPALAASPALAHATDAPHVHGGEMLPLLLGLALIGAGAGAAVLVRVRTK